MEYNDAYSTQLYPFQLHGTEGRMTRTDTKGIDVAGLEKALALVAERQAEAMRGTVVQFPLWPADLVGTPNVLLRNAIFRVLEHTKDEDRPFFVDELIASTSGKSEQVQVKYTGRVLAQQDLDYLEVVLYMLGQEDSEFVTVQGMKMLAVTG